MIELEINRRIAEYMGLSCDNCGMNNECPAHTYATIDVEKMNCHMPLDYCHSLDAVWKVEEKLKAEGKQIDYVLIISAPYEALFQAAHATARQRCEAIIKVLEGEK